ncbi:MAG TPA: type I polyketide synthase, partial [Ktedonobacteraceae bacterium]
MMDNQQEGQATEGVAIIGMAGRFPESATIEAFWQNISAGREAVERIAPEEDRLLQRNPALAQQPQYVPAGAFLEDVDRFDAPFFGYTAREATLLDPQHRLFLECAWEALERSGYDAQSFEGRIGIYAGAGMNTYLLEHLYPHPELVEAAGGFQVMLSSEKDFLATRVAYKLNLHGPAITVQTACSTSLVAVALAYQSLMNYQCDMALAGGVSLLSLEKGGYLYEQGGIASPDGHCRAFDADARGTVGGNGLGIVVLRRLEDALAAGDHIIAVIRGVAMNNDGGEKMGYTTPSMVGQAEVITEALGIADVEPDSISYIETHGTGTFIGDPIEVAALTSAFRQQTERTGFCAIGSVKTNIGHLDVAAGIAGLIKTCLALEHKMLPPSLNFARPNPEINFSESPFYVNTQLQPWLAGSTPRRAGVSAFGIGGTNVHVVLEEAPVQPSVSFAQRTQLLVLSAKTPSALEKTTERLAAFLAEHPDVPLADVACTLQVGRRALNYRRMIVGASHEEVLRQLQEPAGGNTFTTVKANQSPSLVFLYPGQGSQYIHMGQQLYEDEPVYRQRVDECAAFLMPVLKFDVRTLLFPAADQEQSATQRINQTDMTQITLFIAEYAMTRLLMAYGIQPDAMIGHSLGEYVAACVAGVITLKDALSLVAERGRLMQDMQPGAMVSVTASEERLLGLLNEELSIAVVSGPTSCVVGGTAPAVQAFTGTLAREGLEYRLLHTSHAFHSPMMEPMLEPFRQAVQQVERRPPTIPYISCATGTWITPEDVLDAGYWARHVRQTVRIADGIQVLLKQPGRVFIEVGPSQMLKTLLRQISQETARSLVTVTAMRHPLDTQSDRTILLTALGKLWLAGVPVHFAALHQEQARRVQLPTYPFERQRYWIEAGKSVVMDSTSVALEAFEGEAPGGEEPQMRAALLNPYVAPQSEIERQVTA